MTCTSPPATHAGTGHGPQRTLGCFSDPAGSAHVPSLPGNFTFILSPRLCGCPLHPPSSRFLVGRLRDSHPFTPPATLSPHPQAPSRLALHPSTSWFPSRRCISDPGRALSLLPSFWKAVRALPASPPRSRHFAHGVESARPPLSARPRYLTPAPATHHPGPSQAVWGVRRGPWAWFSGSVDGNPGSWQEEQTDARQSPQHVKAERTLSACPLLAGPRLGHQPWIWVAPCRGHVIDAIILPMVVVWPTSPSQITLCMDQTIFPNPWCLPPPLHTHSTETRGE